MTRSVVYGGGLVAFLAGMIAMYKRRASQLTYLPYSVWHVAREYYYPAMD